MNIQRFTAPTSREAMAKARRAFGDGAVILSTRSTEEGFEVMAAAEESLAALPQSNARAPAPRQSLAARAQDSVERDTEALAMSTLSFQEYVRERMLRKRKEATAPAAAPRSPSTPARLPRSSCARSAPRCAGPLAAPTPWACRQSMPPIRTRARSKPAWEDSAPPEPTMGAARGNTTVAWRLNCRPSRT
jgi:flagellar biosynthesis protein FlhF